MSGKIVVLLISSIILVLSCNTTEPPPPEKTITLSLEDAASIEAWIKLTTTNLQLPAAVTLKQNNHTRSTINLNKADTLLYIDSLLPSQQYTFQAITQSSNQSFISNELSVITMDTTSHNITWETWTFGEHSSSVLNDVVIIDENNIWAVGEIYMNDSLGQPDPQPYAIVHWNGTKWLLKKVPYHDFNQTVKHPGPLFSIAVISGEIYVASYANLLKWTGSDWEEKAFFMEQIPFDGQVLKMWGIDQNNIYCVGRNGAIYYYFGMGWQRIESGTDLHLYDIYGEYSEIDGTHEILVSAANKSVSFEKEVLKISNTSTVTSLVTKGIPHSIREIWFKAKRKYYVCGAGLFSKNDIETNEAWEELTVSNVYLWSIDGNDFNDIVISGAFGELLHYNGANWISYRDMPGGSLLISTKIKEDLVVTVGIENPRAFIAIGRR